MSVRFVRPVNALGALRLERFLLAMSLRGNGGPLSPEAYQRMARDCADARVARGAFPRRLARMAQGAGA